jgi:hypothetical protein
LDLQVFRHVIDGDQMASGISRAKTAKLLARDFTAQAAIADVLKNNQLIALAALEARTVTARKDPEQHGLTKPRRNDHADHPGADHPGAAGSKPPSMCT